MKSSVLVTASSRGIGYETAKYFAVKGYTVIINGRNSDELDNLLKDKDDVYRFTCDMTEEGAGSKLKSFLDKNGLFVKCAVNNLGGRIDGDYHPINPEVLEKTMRLNLTSAVETNNILIPEMINNGGGSIFHIGSSAGYTGNAAPCYAISKGALNTYIKNSARFYAKENIMICGVLPGIVDHKGSDWDKKRVNEPEKYENRKKSMPLGRFQRPDEIALVVLSLYESGTMALTGSLIDASGGM